MYSDAVMLRTVLCCGSGGTRHDSNATDDEDTLLCWNPLMNSLSWNAYIHTFIADLLQLCLHRSTIDTCIYSVSTYRHGCSRDYQLLEAHVC